MIILISEVEGRRIAEGTVPETPGWTSAIRWLLMELGLEGKPMSMLPGGRPVSQQGVQVMLCGHFRLRWAPEVGRVSR